MYDSRRLEYIVGSSYSSGYSPVSYFTKSFKESYAPENSISNTVPAYYKVRVQHIPYSNNREYNTFYEPTHSFNPSIFLNPSGNFQRISVNDDETIEIANEIFEAMAGKKLPDNLSIHILSLPEFRLVHSAFGKWGNGILGFSINGTSKQIFARKSNLDELILVIGHEIGHVITERLANSHDEEAKAFAFSIEWAKTIKEKNIANLGASIKDNFDFEPAKNGLHDVAFGFVSFMTKKMKAKDLHESLVKKYISMFSFNYL